MNKLFLLLNINLLILTAFAQNKVKTDSLKQVIATTKQDTVRIKTYLNLGKLYMNSIPDNALSYYNKALKIARNGKEQKLEAKCLKSIGLVYYYQSNYDSTLFYWKKTLKIVEETGEKEAIAGNLGNIGIIYMKQSNYPKALEYYQKALKIDEELGNKEGVARNLGNIGIIYSYLDNNLKALEFYQKSLKFNKETGDKSGIAKNLVNIGNIYDEQGNYSKALEYYQKALKINKDIGNKYGIAANLGNIGNIYNAQNNYSKALEFYQKALKINKESGDREGAAQNLGNIAHLYYKQKQYNKAILFAEKCLKISKEIGTLQNEKYAYLYLSEANNALANYKKALEYYRMYSYVKDSIFNDDKSKSVARLEAKYEYEKKAVADSIANAKQMEIKNAQIAKINAEKDAQRKQRNFLLISLLIGLVFIGIIIRSYIQKNKANKLLAEQKKQIAEANKELKQQAEELTLLNENLNQQNEEITAQRNEIKKQKEEIEEIHKKVSQSIDYAQRIQKSILPDNNIMKKYLSDYFVFFKPKDVVSGDFYWFKKIGKNIVFAVADSTGHGVPGAFMSMLGIAFLNEIITKEFYNSDSFSTALILDNLREKVKTTLHQTGEDDKTKDGMDMSLILFNTETLVLQYSGAYNPLYIVRNKKLTEVKADKMPIGISFKDKKTFTNKKAQLQTGDTLYMFSDGYYDQFGGNTGRKFMKKTFRNLLEKISEKDMQTQKQILENTFSKWKGNMEQTDDILVAGIKI